MGSVMYLSFSVFINNFEIHHRFIIWHDESYSCVRLKSIFNILVLELLLQKLNIHIFLILSPLAKFQIYFYRNIMFILFKLYILL